jgi:hypothetical protein
MKPRSVSEPKAAAVLNGKGRVPVAEPVFVVCAARSGSTLLRFLLDEHPDLVCPPETNIPALCAQLATVWSLIEGAPLSPERGEEPPEIPEAAIGGIRHTMDQMVGSYLARRGGKRYCDKSLGTARFAELLLRVYPEAKFLCLYRHPMDVIASGIEACPWGLVSYGFEPYIAASPGNMVLALARFWADNTEAILAVEEKFPGSCHRVRYEDLVSDPEHAAGQIFGFLGVPPAPGITGRCFTADRERSGPADYKIWHTSSISTSSVGRGWFIPAAQMAAPVLDQVNALAGKLGYLQIDGQWGTTAVPGDMRVTDGEQAGAAPGESAAQQGTAADIERGAILVGERLRAGLAGLDDRFLHRWATCVTAPFGVVITPRGGAAGESGWRVDLATRTITRRAQTDDSDTEWDIIGSAAAWEGLLDGSVNLGVALRRHDLRYCDTGDPEAAAQARVDMLADFLGLASWRQTPAPVKTAPGPPLNQLATQHANAPH